MLKEGFLWKKTQESPKCSAGRGKSAGWGMVAEEWEVGWGMGGEVWEVVGAGGDVAHGVVEWDKDDGM